MKICIERSDRMGDMILTLPIIQGIKEKNPNASIDVVASNKNLKLIQLQEAKTIFLITMIWETIFIHYGWINL